MACDLVNEIRRISGSTFDDIDDETILEFGDAADREISKDLCSGSPNAASKRCEIVAYLAAHKLYISTSGGIGGEVTSEKEGQLSRTYSSTPGDGGGINCTSFGKEYTRLVNGCVFSPTTSGFSGYPC